MVVMMMATPFAATFSARAARSECGVAPLCRREQHGDGWRGDNREFAACGEKMTPRLNGRVLGFLFYMHDCGTKIVRAIGRRHCPISAVIGRSDIAVTEP